MIVGKSRSAITNRLRLLELSNDILSLIEKKEITEGHARALLALSDDYDRIKVAEMIRTKHLSVREVENLIKKLNSSAGINTLERTTDPNISSIIKEMEDFFHSKVNIKTSKKGGVIQVKYNSDTELDTIIKKIRGETC